MTQEQQMLYEYTKAALTGLLRPYNAVDMEHIEETCNTAFMVADQMIHRMKLRLSEGATSSPQLPATIVHYRNGLTDKTYCGLPLSHLAWNHTYVTSTKGVNCCHCNLEVLRLVAQPPAGYEFGEKGELIPFKNCE